jgi:hypothetical protein
MGLRLHLPQSTAGNAATHLPRGFVGEWGVDYQARSKSPRNAICGPATAGGRGR